MCQGERDGGLGVGMRDSVHEGSRVLEHLAVWSLPFSLFMLLGFGFEHAVEVSIPHALGVSAGTARLGLLLALFAGVKATFGFARKRGRRFLSTPHNFEASDAILPIIAWSITSYVGFAALIWMVASALVDPTQEHAGMIVVGMTWWLPIWFVLPFAAFAEWLRLRGWRSRLKRSRTDGSDAR
jgi:hypothetical protein